VDEIIQMLNDRTPEKSWTLTDETRVRYQNPILARARTSDANVRYRLNLNTKTNDYTIFPIEQKVDISPINISSIADPLIGDSEKAAIVATLELGTADLGVELIEGSLNIQNIPPLIFSADHDGMHWDMRYSIEDGSLSGQPRPGGKSIELTNLLIRMHFAHGYPLSFSVRSFWAVVVDCISALMIFWVLSGMLMWWQIKVVRRIGLAVFALSLLISGALMFYMRDMLLQ